MNLKVLKALADETRVRILGELLKKDLYVSEIVPKVKKSQPNVSLALQKLADAGLISAAKEGKNVRYTIQKRELVERLFALLK